MIRITWRYNEKGSVIGLGLILRTAIGVTTDNLGLWLALGVVFGSAREARQAKNEKKKEPEEGR